MDTILHRQSSNPIVGRNFDAITITDPRGAEIYLGFIALNEETGATGSIVIVDFKQDSSEKTMYEGLQLKNMPKDIWPYKFKIAANETFPLELIQIQLYMEQTWRYKGVRQ